MAVPINIPTGRVVGQFVMGVVDGDGPDAKPQFIPARGWIDFTSSPPYLPANTGTAEPVTVLKTTTTAVLDSEGFICTPSAMNPELPARRGIPLMATDAKGSSVEGWTWTVAARFVDENGAGLAATIPEFNFALPSNSVIDLTSVVKVPASPGIGEDQSKSLAAAAQASAQSAAADAKRATTDAALALTATAKIPADIASAIAADTTVADAAAGAVNTALDDAEIMRGRVTLNINPVEDVAWRQTTEDGYYLPLGYTPAGRLDEFAKRIWREDVNRTVESFHPDYARAMVTEDGRLLAGLTWEGRWDFPGINLPEPEPVPTPPPVEPAKPIACNDAPYVPGSDVRPPTANPTKWAMWGSSSAGGIATLMAQMAVSKGVYYFNGGWGGERSSHISARLGSVPGKLTFPDNKVPATGEVIITSSNLTYGNMKTFAGHMVTAGGQRVYGTLRTSNNTLLFARASSDTAGEVTVPANVEFIPTDGPTQRDAITFLWMGKNNTHETQRVIDETNASFDYLAPLVKRCMVLGHFNNTNTSPTISTRKQIKTINDAYAARFGMAFVDIDAYLVGEQIWKDTGVTPLPVDLEQQAIGNKPPSLSSDDGHMNDIAYRAVRTLIETRMRDLGWIK